MTAAMLIALLLQSGACSESRFHNQDGATLSIVVCPMLTPKEDDAPPAADDTLRAPSDGTIPPAEKRAAKPNEG